MPSTFAGVLILILFLTPGLFHYLQRRRRAPQRTLSPLIETATLIAVSVSTNLAALGIFAIARWLWPHHTPDPERLLLNGSTYASKEPGYLLGWGALLFVVSCALAVGLGRFADSLPGPAFLTPLVVDASGWYQEFEAGPPGFGVYVACDLDDGAHIGGLLDWYSTEISETADRDLALSPPFAFTKDGVESTLEGFDRVILSARCFRRLYVSFVRAEHDGP